jgi:plasmid stabilization system protein ParE
MTQRPWRLTRAAELTLTDIAQWTYANFGPVQAQRYAEDLIAACEAIAAGTAHSQDCRRIIGENLSEDIRFARAGQHFVVFVQNPTVVIILDFLHSKSNLPARIEAITAQDKG